ncbi:MAG: pyruvate kinase [Phycisphaera sp.]|nr:MAG: pyruvate kinase [Phycisphaera sp.]
MTPQAECTQTRFPTVARIVATIGPSSDSPEMVRRLITLGVRVFRFNFSHGSFDDHENRLKVVREVSKEMDRPIAVMADLPGPKIRCGQVPDGGFDLEVGQEVVFTNEIDVAELVQEDAKTVAHFPTTYPELTDEVEIGQRVLLNDGAVRLLVIAKDDGWVRCTVTVGGLITTGKGINLPETELSAPAVGDRDWEICQWAVSHAVDFIAMSFVRRAEEVRGLRDRLAGICSVDVSAAEKAGSRIPIVAKIEKPQAVNNIREIAESADVIMVARGDLGVEMDIAQTPVSQKKIIETCKSVGTPVIVATQMLETMITASSPTRAEASDVANAVFDGADAVMLSGETAVGDHPDLVVDTMTRIIRASEDRLAKLPSRATPPELYSNKKYKIAAIAHGAWHVAQDFGAELIVCWSQHGTSARFLSQNNFDVPIVAYSSERRFTRRMALLGGVNPFRRDPPGGFNEFVRMAEKDLVKSGWAIPGSRVVILGGEPFGTPHSTSSIVAHVVRDQA